MTRKYLLPLALLSTVLAACGDETTDQPEILSFTADRTAVQAGETVTLSWQTAGANKIAISSTPSEGGSATDLPASGTFTSQLLSAKTTFKLTITADSRDQKEASVTVDVSGISIVSFTATPASGPRNSPVTLSYQIAGTPASTTITDAAGRVVFMGGSETTATTTDMPQASTTYTLKVTSPAGNPEATASVEITAVQPEILSFIAGDVIQGEQVALAWQTRDATEVQILQDGVVRRPWNTSGAASGNTRFTVDTVMTTFRLEARNVDGMVFQDLTVTAMNRPIISTFELTPASFNTPSTPASLTYATELATSVALRINGQVVAEFPAGQLSGTFNFTATGGDTVVQLTAINAVAQTVQEGTIEAGYEEEEPNDLPSEALTADPNGAPFRAQVGLGDVDYFSVVVPAGGRIFASAGVEGTTCTGDTMLSLYAPNGTTLLGSNDEPALALTSPCATINPLLDGYADNLSAGTYYLAVEGGMTQTSTVPYTLTVVVTGAATPLTGIMYTAIGTPIWDVTDCNVFSTTIGDGATGFGPFLAVMDEIFRPAHVTEPAAATLINEVPHQRDYSSEITTAVLQRGFDAKTTFSEAEYTPPEGLSLFCMMLPTASSTVGRTFDGENMPLIENALFPLMDTISVTRDGVPYGMDFMEQLPSLNDLGLPDSELGMSHRILRDLQSPDFGPGNVPLTGNYVWSHTIIDTTGSGWRIDVNFVVQ